MPAEEFLPPEHFDEFRLVRKLGEGAMGQVFLCTDQTLHRSVAVKFLKVASTSRIDRERCLTEARAIARLTHANVVTIYRVGETQGVPYIASEFIEGTSLDLVPMPLPFERVLPIAVSLARGLAVAHERGVLHRDIKPANIMITKNSEVKLLDFGVAKLLEEPQPSEANSAAPDALAESHHKVDGGMVAGEAEERESARSRSIGNAATNPEQRPQPEPRRVRPVQSSPVSATLASTSPVKPRDRTSDPRTSVLDVGSASTNPAPSDGGGIILQESSRARSNYRVGTPLYMSPETWLGETISPRADIYSLGAVLFELSAGFPPHDELDMQTLQIAATTEDAPPLMSAAPKVPAWFAQVVDRCLKREASERFASGAELLKALEFPPREPEAVIIPPSPLAVPPPRYGRTVAIVAASSLVVAGSLSLYLSRPVSGMVTLTGGTFLMGATRDDVESAQRWCEELLGKDCDEVVKQAFRREEPQRQVFLSAFRLDRREVTTEEFVGWLNQQKGLEFEGGRYVKQSGALLADIYPTYQPFAGYAYDLQSHRFFVPAEFRRRPATQLSWEAASRYCAAQHKRLPTEAEWELAARGSEGRRFPWGFAEPSCESSVLARVQGMQCAKEGIGPRDVASTHADRTPDGIFDLGGNVSEWVLDDFVEQYPACPPPCQDPVVPPTKNVARAVRGGNWEWPALFARGTTRSRYSPSTTPKNFGFRCAEPLNDRSMEASNK